MGPAEEAGPGAEVMRSRIAERLFGEGATIVHVGRFELAEQLGAGGMGVVHRAFDPRLNRDIAVKILRNQAATDSERQRLLHEAQALAQLNHPNVVSIFEIGEHQAHLFLAMEYVAGSSGRQWAQAKSQPWRAALGIYLQAGDGLAAAHAAGLVHRDFKPANLLIGDDGRVRVADFGLAASHGAAMSSSPGASASSSTTGVTDERLTRTGAVLGTPAYMAPEQLHGQPADARSDQFSFCVALWEAIAGRRPFSVAALKSGQRKKITLESGVPSWLTRALLRGLSQLPDDRWPDMDTLLSELRDAPGRRMRRGVVLLLAASIAGLVAVRGSTQPVPGCSVSPQQLRERYDEDRPKIETALRQAGHAGDVGVATTLQTLDRFATQWGDAATQYCDATLDAIEPRQAACLRRSANSYRLVSTSLQQAPAESFEHLGRVLAALRPAQDCDVTQPLATPRAPDQRRTLELALDAIDNASVLNASGRAQAAETEADRGIALAETIDAPDAASEGLMQRALARRQLSDIKGAVADFNKAAAEAYAGDRDDVYAQAWTELVEIAVVELEDLDRASGWAQLARTAASRPNTTALQLAQLVSALGSLQRASGNPLGAEVMFRSATSIARDAGPQAHDVRRAAVTRTANVLAAQGRRVEASQLYERARILIQDRYGAAHPSMGSMELNLALLARSRGDAEQVLQHGRAAAAIYTKVYGAQSLKLAAIHTTIAEALVDLQHYAAAIAEATQGWDIAREYLPPTHSEYTSALSVRARAHLDSEDWSAALLDHLEIERVLTQRDDPQLPIVQLTLAWLYTELGRLEDAEQRCNAAAGQISANSWLADYLVVGRALVSLARGDEASVITTLQPMHDRLSVTADPGSEVHAEVAWALAHALAATNGSAQRVRALVEYATVQYRRHAPARRQRIAALQRIAR